MDINEAERKIAIRSAMMKVSINAEIEKSKSAGFAANLAYLAAFSKHASMAAQIPVDQTAIKVRVQLTDEEMRILQECNQVSDDEPEGYTGCAPCNGSGCDRCMPQQFDDGTDE